MPRSLWSWSLGLLLLTAATAEAQTPYERASLDTTIGVDLFRGAVCSKAHGMDYGEAGEPV